SFTEAAARERRSGNGLWRWMKDDLPATADVVLPHPLLLMLLPLGLLSLGGNSRWVLALTLPLALAAYGVYTFSVPYYLVIAAPAAALIALSGIRSTEHAWPRAKSFIVAFAFPAVLITAITRLPQADRTILDDMFRPDLPRIVHDKLATLPRRPAIVLFRYHAGLNNPQEEPVYNTDVAWPDDADVIRAHDLGARNV